MVINYHPALAISPDALHFDIILDALKGMYSKWIFDKLSKTNKRLHDIQKFPDQHVN